MPDLALPTCFNEEKGACRCRQDGGGGGMGGFRVVP